MSASPGAAQSLPRHHQGSHGVVAVLRPLAANHVHDLAVGRGLRSLDLHLPNQGLLAGDLGLAAGPTPQAIQDLVVGTLLAAGVTVAAGVEVVTVVVAV